MRFQITKRLSNSEVQLCLHYDIIKYSREEQLKKQDLATILLLLVGAHCFMEGDRVNFLETTLDNI